MRKLTPELIQAIQKRKAEGATNRELSDEFGVSYGSIVNACQAKPHKPKPAPVSTADPEDTPRIKTLRQMLDVHRARLKLSIGNEAKTGKTNAATDRISKEIERLEKLIELESSADCEPEPEPVATAITPTDDKVEIVQLLRNSVSSLNQIAQTARENGNMSAFTSIQRVFNATISQLAKLDPPPPPKEENPDWIAAAESCKLKMREKLQKIIDNAKPV